jgi:16S rRNA (cytosine967-C5)-methyltransferase
LVRYRRTIDFLLPIACNDSSVTFFMLPIEERLLARFAVGLMVCKGINSYDIAVSGFPESVSRIVLGLGDARPILERQSPALRRLGIENSAPDWLVEKLSAQSGIEEAEKLLVGMNQRAPLWLRANTFKNDVLSIQAMLKAEGYEVEKGDFSPWSLKLGTRVNIRGLKAFKSGFIEAQDEGSQLIAEITGVKPEHKVIDYCAGAGGKTLALGAMMGGKGALLACDIDEHRLEKMRPRLKRSGLTSVCLQNLSEPLPSPWSEGADCVLVDAPCTGSGTFRRQPERKYTLQEEDLQKAHETQVQILAKAAPRVAVGGRLVYATCSIFDEENEKVISRFREQHSDFKLVPLDSVLGDVRAKMVGDGVFLKMMPHTHDSDGFFGAVFERV